MDTTLIYNSNKGVVINGIELNWGLQRQKVRELLNHQYISNDDESSFQFRDSYTNYNDQDNYFFFNYDKNDLLEEVEIHNGFTIIIEGIGIDFTMDIKKVLSLLEKASNEVIELSKGEYLFSELKLTIANAKSIGGTGNRLSYFYCAKEINHLID